MKKGKNGFITNLRYLCLVGVITLGLITIVGSNGGGGGDGGAAPATQEPGTINSTTAPQTASAVGTIITGVEVAILPVALDIGSGAYCPKTLLRHADDLIFNPYSARSALGELSETEPCSYGGSITLNLTWDGPDDPADCSEVRNPRMEFLFDYCQEYNESMNGTMGMYFSGDLCTETPAAFGMYFTNLRYQNQVDGSDLTLNLTMDFSNVQYDQYDYMVGMNVSLDGSISGTFEGTSADMDYNDWTLAFSNIRYDESNEIVEMTVTFDGSFSGTIDEDTFNESYDNVVLTFQDTAVDSTQGILFTLNGSYKGACLDGWVTIETIEPIFWPESSECPTAGQIKISGNGEATIVCHSDGSVTIDVGKDQLDYASCDDLPPCI
jgi:hypothetical protein